MEYIFLLKRETSRYFRGNCSIIEMSEINVTSKQSIVKKKKLKIEVRVVRTKMCA